VLRVEAAVKFAASFAEPLFIPTGAVGRHGPSEASVMAELLHARGIAENQILPEETGTDTLSSVRAVAALLRSRGIGAPVFAASSLYHLPRCVSLLHLTGIRAHAAIPPIVPAATHWWHRCYWWLREIVALPYDCSIAILLRTRRSQHG
jgi:vancomycin permeability regulator SanA